MVIFNLFFFLIHNDLIAFWDLEFLEPIYNKFPPMAQREFSPYVSSITNLVTIHSDVVCISINIEMNKQMYIGFICSSFMNHIVSQSKVGGFFFYKLKCVLGS